MNILIVLPTNIGDAIMGFPVIDRMHAAYPDADITVFTSPRTDELTRRHAFVDNTFVFDKHWTIGEKIGFVVAQIGHYDMVIDLKNSFLPFLLGASRFTPCVRRLLPDIPRFMQYLNLINKLVDIGEFKRGEIILSDIEKASLAQLNVMAGSVFVFLAARSNLKIFPQDSLRSLIEPLSGRYPVVICGEKVDEQYYSSVSDLAGVVNLCGKTKMPDIFYLLCNYARGAIAVDSGAMHAASYCDTPIIGLYGPTSSSIYGPWSKKHKVLRARDVSCAPCEKHHCVHNKECMDIPAQIILDACYEQFNG
jgi:ADP-heptose:LPS heptosyltransferase